MLLDKLEEENRATRRRRLQLAGVFVGGALFLGLFLVAAMVVSPGNDEPASDPEIVRADNNPVVRVENNVPDEVTRPSPASPGPDETMETSPAAGSGDDVVPDPDETDTVARDAFKAAVVSFQKELEPEIMKPAFAVWNEAAQRDVLAERDRAFEAFSQGRYADALTSLEAAAKRASEELKARDAAFETALNAAQSAFNADNHEEAVPEIDRALELKPDSVDAAELNTRITELPAVLSAIGKASVARVENNLEVEEEHLTTALTIDPSREELASRREVIRTTLREQTFSAQIESGLGNLLARRLEPARSNLRQARTIYPDRSETQLLSSKIAVLAEQLEFENLMRSANMARQSDDWRAAEDYYARAGAIVGDDPQVTGGYELAGDINRLGSELAKILDAPERLSSEAVAGKAAEQVSRARDLAELSPALANEAGKVAKLLEEYGTKVSIRILSDGITRISVRGVGQVGTTTDRTIQLRPGSYTFEGTRAGFRSKLIEVDIPPGIEGLVLEIYPNEPV